MGETNIIVGVPGTGKTAILDAARPLFDDEYEHFHIGKRFVDVAMDTGVIDSPTDSIELDDYREVARETARRIAEASKDEQTLVTIHSAIRVEGGFMPGVASDFIQPLSPARIILIESDPEEVTNRIKNRAREIERPTFPPEEVKRHQRIERQFAASAAVATATPLMTIENKDGVLEEAAETLAELLNDGQES